jgi:hypothetical protein
LSAIVWTTADGRDRKRTRPAIAPTKEAAAGGGQKNMGQKNQQANGSTPFLPSCFPHSPSGNLCNLRNLWMLFRLFFCPTSFWQLYGFSE